MKSVATLTITTLVLLILTYQAFAHESEYPQDVTHEIEKLKLEQTLLRQELQEIKSLLQKRQVPKSDFPKNLSLDIEKEPVKGAQTAKLTIIEFTDYQCTFCRRHASRTFPQLEQEYVETGKIQYVVRDFPLQSIHKEAFQAAVAANCAGQQGKYWDMHDRLLSIPITPELDWEYHVRALGIDWNQFGQCLEEKDQSQEVQLDLEDGRKAGVRGTPTFFLGFSDPNNQSIKVIKVMRGAKSFASFKTTIDQLLVAQP